MAKDAYYFPHDSNARNDLKMLSLRRKHGLAGIGLYWCVIEILRETENYEIDESTKEVICFDMRCDESIFDFLIECELLVINKGKVYSNSLKNRMLKLDSIKEKRAIAGQKGGKSKANFKHLPSNCLANEEHLRSNKIREDKIREDKSKLEEINNITSEKFILISQEKIFDIVEALNKNKKIEYESLKMNKGYKDYDLYEFFNKVVGQSYTNYTHVLNAFLASKKTFYEKKDEPARDESRFGKTSYPQN